VDAQARLRVAVVGVGSIGGVVAASLCHARLHEVFACTRHPIDRLVVERPEGEIDVRLQGIADPSYAYPVDWVVLSTKAHQTSATAPWLARLCAPSTRVAVLQNGIRHVERVAPLAGGATVVPTVVYYNGERLANDRVRLRHAYEHDLVVPDDTDGRDFANLLRGTQLRVHASADFTTTSWKKLLTNIVANPITALTLQRLAVLQRDDIRALCLAILEEAIAVASADGAHVSERDAQGALAMVSGFPAEGGTSMLFDRLAGRRLEVEAVTGTVVSLGERHGIPTPLNRALLALLRAIDDAADENRVPGV
jgi:2-dehydropantoate 2-reductase